jgi:thiol-disulfide isomerase/thioredoxin
MPQHSKIRQIVNRSGGWLFNILFFAVVFFGVSAYQSRNMLSTSGTEAPGLSGPLLRGGSYDIDMAGERPTLIYFFAPWCTICAASSDNLARLRRLRDDESLHILAVALDWPDIEAVSEYVDRHELDVPVVLGDGQVARDWQIHAFPTYYVLDSAGRICRRDLGYSSQFGLWWRTWFID